MTARDRVIEEGVAPAFVDGAAAGWTMGSLGTAKGILSMMTQLSCSPLHIDSLPEGRGGEEDGVGVARKLLA